MSEKLTIGLEMRSVIGKKVKRLRKQGILPATVYGKGVGPYAVQMSARAFQDVLRRAGKTRLIELSIPGQPTVSAFVHMLQRHLLTREISHVDFRAVDLKVRVTVAVPVHIVGTSELLSRGDAILNQALNAIEVNALPAELPSHIEVDVSGLDSFDKSIHVRDLQLGEGLNFMIDEDELVVSLTPARAEEVEETVEEPTSAEPELVREKHDDEDSE